MSRDHDWGLRLTVLVDADRRDAVLTHFRGELPETWAGIPTSFVFTGQSETALAVHVDGPGRFTRSRLGLDPRDDMRPVDWLTLTGQAVLEVVAGPVFHDSAGEITEVRNRLAWYPDDVWRYLIACDWARLGEEMPLMSRAGDRGDDLGSRVIAARLVDIAIHLGFLLERQWAPYSKWRGATFAELPGMHQVLPHLTSTLRSETWQQRQDFLAQAVNALQNVQVSTGLPGGTPATVGFWNRPYLHPDPAIIAGLLDSIRDPVVRGLPLGRGSIEQQSDNVALLVDPGARRSAVTFE